MKKLVPALRRQPNILCHRREFLWEKYEDHVEPACYLYHCVFAGHMAVFRYEPYAGIYFLVGTAMMLLPARGGEPIEP